MAKRTLVLGGLLCAESPLAAGLDANDDAGGKPCDRGEEIAPARRLSEGEGESRSLGNAPRDERTRGEGRELGEAALGAMSGSRQWLCLSHSRQPPELNPAWRAAKVRWLFSLQQKIGLGMRTVVLTIDVLDRFLEKHPIPSGCTCLGDIAATAALSLAWKMEEVEPPPDVGAISSPVVSSHYVAKMEMVILEALGWALARPTTCTIIERLLQELPIASVAHKRAIFVHAFALLRLIMHDHDFLSYSRANVAAAVLAVSVAHVMPDPAEAAVLEERLRELTGKRALAPAKALIEYHVAVETGESQPSPAVGGSSSFSSAECTGSVDDDGTAGGDGSPGVGSKEKKLKRSSPFSVLDGPQQKRRQCAAPEPARLRSLPFVSSTPQL
mmetsp:Transcript_17714/g.57950  ORF Transcript_17714/g.57950 Transcript_17714/m.57950 type:complete len:385 (+) Transcript_17714:205-1359(+)